jgi:hypothetical protein
MKRIFPIFQIFICLLSFAQFPGGRSLRLKPEQIKFQYIPYEDQGITNCQHVIENELAQDWSVKCGEKKFSVHLWLTEYNFSQAPEYGLELLYWVNDRSRGGQSVDTGTSLWMKFKNKSQIDSLTAKQGVENDTAGLYLEITP